MAQWQLIWQLTVWIYVGFGVVVAAALAFYRPKRPEDVAKVVAFTCIGALTFLPAAAYFGVMPEVELPPWFIGALLPSKNIVVNKSWIAPLAALVVGMRLDWRRFAGFRPALIDLPITLFCLLPFLQMLVVPTEPAPPPFKTSLMLFGSWGLPWLLGRIYLSDRAGRVALADALILCTLLLVPIAVMEGLSATRIHELFLGPHPFSRDGVTRPIGFRPLAFFEHGNQYGIWVGAAAFAAWWRARHARRGGHQLLRWLAALVLIAMALAAQSLGGIVLLILAIIWLEFAPLLDHFPWLWRGSFAGVVWLGVTVAQQLYTGSKTGVQTELVKQLIAMIGDARQQSLVWRMDRGLDSIAVIKEQLLLGYGRWDWYSIGRFRPWDLTLMLVGQFGLVGLGLIVLTLVSAMMLRRRDLAGGPGSTRHLLLALAAMGIADATLNTYVFYPSLIALGALATSPVRRAPVPRASVLEEDRRAVGPEPSWLESAPTAIRPGKKM